MALLGLVTIMVTKSYKVRQVTGLCVIGLVLCMMVVNTYLIVTDSIMYLRLTLKKFLAKKVSKATQIQNKTKEVRPEQLKQSPEIELKRQ